jgi:HSP90 family molecular chaperone
MASLENSPWRGISKSSHLARLQRLKDFLSIDEPILLIPIQFQQANLKGEGLLFTPQDQQLVGKLGFVELWLNNRIIHEKADGFLPPYYDFVTGVLDIEWTEAPLPKENAVQDIKRIFKPFLEERLVHYLKNIKEDTSFSQLINEYSREIRIAAATSPRLYEEIGDVIRMSDGSQANQVAASSAERYSEPIFKSESSAAGGGGRKPPDEKVIYISTRLDLNKKPYQEIYHHQLFGHVLYLHEVEDYMILRRHASTHGIQLKVVDSLESLVSLLGLKSVSETSWQGLVSDLSSSLFDVQASAYLMGDNRPPAVMLPSKDEDAAILRELRDEEKINPPMLENKDALEYTRRMNFRKRGHGFSWELVINADHPLTRKISGLSWDSSARRIGVNQLVALARADALGYFNARAWNELEDLIDKVNKLEKKNKTLQAADKRQTKKITQLENALLQQKHKYRVGMSRHTKERQRIQNELQAERERHAATEKGLIQTTNALRKVIDEMRQLSIDDETTFRDANSPSPDMMQPEEDILKPILH